MGRYNISRKAWRTATDVLLYYPDNKKEYAHMLDVVLTVAEQTVMFLIRQQGPQSGWRTVRELHA